MFGPDVKASVTIDQLKQIVEGSKFISKMLATKIDLSKRTKEKEDLKTLFSKSLFANDTYAAGTLIERGMFSSKKPNIGIDASLLPTIIGKSLKKDLKTNEPLRWEDIET
jgi:N-acetylneuraminate synthase